MMFDLKTILVLAGSTTFLAATALIPSSAEVKQPEAKPPVEVSLELQPPARQCPASGEEDGLGSN